jgi:hypothetical protein
MAYVADFIVIKDGPFRLVPSEERTFSFTLPTAPMAGLNYIIAFLADPSSDASNLECEIHINTTLVRSPKFNGGTLRAFWEAFGGEILISGQSNGVKFEVISGTGSVSFSDVILWLRKKIEDV